MFIMAGALAVSVWTYINKNLRSVFWQHGF